MTTFKILPLAACVAAVMLLSACASDQGEPANRPKPFSININYNVLTSTGEHTALTVRGYEDTITVSFKGRSYDSLDEAIPDMQAELMQTARQTPRLQGRLGGKATIIEATFNHYSVFTAVGHPEFTEINREASRAYARAVADANVEALRSSHLFKTVESRREDITGSPPLEGADYVLWQEESTPWVWHVRTATRDEAVRITPTKGGGPGDFPMDVRAAIEHGQAAP